MLVPSTQDNLDHWRSETKYFLTAEARADDRVGDELGEDLVMQRFNVTVLEEQREDFEDQTYQLSRTIQVRRRVT